jgi:hypothetical protein
MTDNWYVVLELTILAVGYVALGTVIVKAGFSAWWILVPLSPIIVSIAFYATSQTAGTIGLTSVPGGESWSDAIYTSFVANWVGFLIFAFMAWPVRTAEQETGVRAPRRSSIHVPRPGAVSPTPARATATSTVAPPELVPTTAAVPVPASSAPSAPPAGDAVASTISADAPAPVAAPVPPEPTTTFCPWCGKERAIDALVVHHCGSTSRPAAYCARCGTPVIADESSCESCGASLEVVRRR